MRSSSRLGIRTGPSSSTLKMSRARLSATRSTSPSRVGSSSQSRRGRPARCGSRSPRPRRGSKGWGSTSLLSAVPSRSILWQPTRQTEPESGGDAPVDARRSGPLEAHHGLAKAGNIPALPRARPRSLTRTVRCSQCGHENPEASKFCAECGTRFGLFCPSCGRSNAAASKFCNECGHRLATADVTGGAGATGSPALPATATVDSLTPSAIDAPAGAPGDAATSTGVVSPARLIEERFASPHAYTPKHLAEKILVSASAMEGERKQVTVVFTDVSGFTSLASRLDPEAVHEIMDRFFEIVLASVHAYKGTVNQFLGDGVMALFGAPIAHEDHAHRALRAALGIRAGLVPLRDHVQQRHGIDFRVRIGINTGPVVVGAIGRDLRMDYTAVGDTTNLASRILNKAGSGQIELSAKTKHLRDRVFTFEDLGQFQVKGKDEPIRVWTVSAEISGRTRLAVSRERGLTPLIGRDRELVRLATGFRQAANGYGAIVVLVGE